MSRPLSVFAVAALTATLLSTSPAVAEESRRAPQPFGSAPVQPVAGAGSAFNDAAAN